MPGVNGNLPSVTAMQPLDCAISSPAHALLEQLSTHPQVAGLGVGVLRIVQLIDRAEAAVPELTRMMMAEPFIAQKLISSANVALSRRGMPPITTISKAIILLGMEQVRTLALSTLLVSKLGNRRQANRIQSVRPRSIPSASVCGKKSTAYRAILRSSPINIAIAAPSPPLLASAIEVVHLTLHDGGVTVSR